jgi:O-antigen ligase
LRRSPSPRGLVGLFLFLGLTLFLFAGEYDWMAWPLAAAAIVLTIVVRPAVGGRDTRWLDLALLAYVCCVAVQRVLLPPSLRLWLSPALRGVDLQLRIDAPAIPSADTPHALSVNPQGTTLSLLVAISVVLTFWCARTIFARGGVRFGARAVALIGLALAAFGVVQHTIAPHSFYGTTVPRQASPFGPYLNHSDFATWLVMGLLLTIGYVIARLFSRQPGAGPGSLPQSLESFDNRALWLTLAAASMAAALVVGLSRSGLVAAAAGFVTLWALSNSRLKDTRRTWVLGAFGLVAVVALLFTNTTAMAGRIEQTINGVGGRTAIWRATWPITQDFWRTGIGAGAFERAMVVYQPAPHQTFFNHAHNDYLQMLTEGGVLLTVPAIAAIAAGFVAIRRRLQSDRSSMYWIRAGAVSGLVAVAVQSIWETGLRVPANTLLFATLAAVVLHEGHERSRS